MKLDDHPTVKWYREQERQRAVEGGPQRIEPQVIRDLCLDAGADDVGFVEIDRAALSDQRDKLLHLLPGTRTLVCTAYQLNRENLRAVAHSMTNLEYQQAWKEANTIARTAAGRLQRLGFRALNLPVGMPMEMDGWPENMWVAADKINAVEAGLGRMGWNRLVLHPKFGSAVIFGTILTDAELTSYNSPLDYDPCIQCKLCASVCPTGAIAADGHFDFVSCYTHNYRERLGGFADWIERIASSRSVKEYRRKVTDAETVSMWQNLSVGGQTRCDRCVGVCPAGEEAIGNYLEDRQGYLKGFWTEMRERAETIYVVPGSDAEAHVKAHFPHKAVKCVSNGIRPDSAAMFLTSLPIVFQRNRAEGLDATFHFTFTGAETCKGTAVIKDKTLILHDGLVGEADLRITADSRTWVSFLAKETHLLLALATRKIRVKGSPKLMMAFAKCFPI